MSTKILVTFYGANGMNEEEKGRFVCSQEENRSLFLLEIGMHYHCLLLWFVSPLLIVLQINQ